MNVTKKKGPEVVPAAIEVFGIKTRSRRGIAQECLEMLAFCTECEARGVASMVYGVFYDSKASVASIELEGFCPEDGEAVEMVGVIRMIAAEFFEFALIVYEEERGRSFVDQLTVSPPNKPPVQCPSCEGTIFILAHNQTRATCPVCRWRLRFNDAGTPVAMLPPNRAHKAHKRLCRRGLIPTVSNN